ncbi:MAG TPA: alpha-amylase family glycosyl hydrolase [Verrucomicrobiae bacterium]|nr:alpha-amylase family glycosyl hydrolase [Verrucomicrobiae bacterium]
MAHRLQRHQTESPLAFYQVDLASWMRVPEEGNRPLTYRELAPKLADYAMRMGFTHLQLMPVMEHPPGHPYQITGYFAPDSRHGAPQDLMYLIDHLHQHVIGVILDWVPAHFPAEEPGLAYFDGTQLYERGFCRLALAEDPGACSFDYERGQVRSFILSNALFWLEKYHADGLRLDSLEVMLFLDFALQSGQWVPNPHGGRENLAGLDFLKRLNTEVSQRFPDVLRIAQETTAWPMLTHPAQSGGAGFSSKWDQHFIDQTLDYFSHEPCYRKFHHNKLTQRAGDVFSERFVLPLSHQLVLPGHNSILARMPGDEWQRFANVRLLLSYLYLEPVPKAGFLAMMEMQLMNVFVMISYTRHQCQFTSLACRNPLVQYTPRG